MGTEAIAKYDGGRGLSMAETIQFAQSVSGGSLLPVAYQRNPANVIIAVNLGQSMGLSPAESLYRINVIKGKPTASAELIATQVRKAGHKLRIAKDAERQSVTATIVRCDDPDYPISETRDIEWARKMGLAGKENYQRQPMTMLTWRAITACAREACPEALYGVAYTPDEMADGEAVRTEPVSVQDVPEEQADLSAMREAFAEYRDATGETNEEIMRSMCDAVGASDPKTMTQEQADAATEWLRRSAQPASEQEQYDQGEGDLPAGYEEFTF